MTMDIIFVTFLLAFGGLLWIGLIAIGLGGYYLSGRLILKGIRQAFLRPGTTQVAAYEIRTPDPKEDDAEDARPMICLELSGERHGQHYREHTEKNRFSTEPFPTPTIV